MARSSFPVLYGGGSMTTADEQQATTGEATNGRSPPECPNCSGRLANRPHETVCVACGLVVQEEEIDRGPEWRDFDDGPGTTMRRCNDGGLTATHHDNGLGTEIGHSENSPELSRLRRMNQRARFASGGERNQGHANGAIKRVTSSLDLPKSITVRACKLYKHAQEAGLVQGRCIEEFVGGAVYAACREEELGRLPEEVATASRLSDGDLGGNTSTTDAIQGVYSELCRELGLTPKPPTPSDYIARIVSGLDVSATTNAVATKLATIADGHRALSGRAPSGVGGACVYSAAQATGDSISQEAVAEEAGVTAVTIRNSSRMLMSLDAARVITLEYGFIPRFATELDMSPSVESIATELATVGGRADQLDDWTLSDIAASCILAATQTASGRLSAQHIGDRLELSADDVEACISELEARDTVKNIYLKHGYIPEASSRSPPSPPSTLGSTQGPISAD